MKKFLTMALALMMVLSLFAVPTMAEVVLGEDLLNNKGTFEDYATGTTFPAAGTDQFKVHADNQMTATIAEAEDGNKYVKVTPAADNRKPQLYFTQTELVNETAYLTAVEAGKTYSLNFKALLPEDTTITWNCTYNQTLYYYINYYDSTGSMLSTKYYDAFQHMYWHCGEWTDCEAYFTVPEGVSYIQGYICNGIAGKEVSLDDITLKETNRISPTSGRTYGSYFLGDFEDAKVNAALSTGYGNTAIAGGSAQLNGTSTTQFYAAYNSESVEGISPYQGDWYVGIGTTTENLPTNTGVNVNGQIYFTAGTTPALAYGETYNISVMFNAANAKDSYTGEEGDLPMVPMIIINNSGTTTASRGTERFVFEDAWKTDGWQKLEVEWTVPEESYYTNLTASGSKAGAMDVGLACYSSAGSIGYFDNLVITKKIATTTTEYAVTISGDNAVTSVAAATSTGDAVNFTVAPKFGYYIDSITIGEEDFTGFDAYKGGTYSTGEISADTAIVVTVAELSANTDVNVSTDVATLPAVFAPAADSAVTFGKVLDTTDATSWGIELTKDGVGVTPANGGSYLYKANATNTNGQYAIEFIGLEAGTYTIRSYVYVNGTATFGAPATFIVE